ncbi:hypothetical protein [Lutibacter sp.]|uniref:hypothetical protein n=1 Tax=Lutibacter sp. TaxID=1925666 RepID=UPI001A20F6DA|nr:hypothetical protein [Lutibacter sp.]MBI9040125.1 hypothetical protein [Lutibacter sp.]
MKKILIFALMVSVTFISCKNEKGKEPTEPVSTNKVETVVDGTYTANTESSILN